MAASTNVDSEWQGASSSSDEPSPLSSGSYSVIVSPNSSRGGLWGLLLPKREPSDPLDRHLVEPLAVFLLSVVISALVAIPVFATLSAPGIAGKLLVTSPTCGGLVALVALALLRLGRFAPAVVVSCWGIFLAVSVVVVPYGSPACMPFLPVYLVPVIIAGLLGRPGHAVGVSCASIVIFALLSFLGPYREELTLLVGPPRHGQSVATWTFGLTSAVVLASVWSFGSRLRRSFSTSVAAADELARAQSGLEQKVVQSRDINHQLSRRTKELEALTSMADLLLASQSPDESYTIISGLLRQMFSIGTCRLYVVSDGVARLVASSTSKVTAASFAASDCWALRRGRLHRNDHGSFVRCAHAELDRLDVCIPVATYNDTRAILRCTVALDSAQADSEIRRAYMIAEQLALALTNLWIRDELRRASRRDALTGLLNRRSFRREMTQAVQRSVRQGDPISLIMVDIDHFKKINDTKGHAAGDEALRAVARSLEMSARSGDLVCRLGGEEFAVVLLDTPLELARAQAETLREAVASSVSVHADGGSSPVTVSLGVATVPTHARSLEDMMRAADDALYVAKREGRNRVRVAKCARPGLSVEHERVDTISLATSEVRRSS